MLTPSDIQQVQNMISAFQKKSQFSISPVPKHIHDNVGSPKISYKNLLNTPQIFSGSLDNTTVVFLPVSWTLTKNGTGDYTITHGLGTTRYAVTATATENSFSSLQTLCMIATISANSFEVLTGNTANGNLEDRSFNFVLYVQP